MSLLPTLEALVVETAERYDAEARTAVVAEPSAEPVPPRTTHRPGRRWPFVLAGASGLAIAGTVAALLIDAGAGNGSSPLDVVAEARAALAPAPGILHIDFSMYGNTYVNGKPMTKVGEAKLTQHIEQWSATDPTRYRMYVHESKETFPRQPTVHLLAHSEFAWAGRAQTSYDGDHHTMVTVTGFNANSSASYPPAIVGVRRSLDDIQDLFAAGRLKDAGAGSVDGHPVRRLLGKQSSLVNRPGTVEYDVDPTSFKPVRIVTRSSLPSNFMGPRKRAVEVTVATFNAYEHLPLNGTTERLLAVHPPAGTKIVVRTVEQQRAYGRRQLSRMNAEGRANLRKHELADAKARARKQRAAERAKRGG